MKNSSNHNNTKMSGVKIFVNLPIEASIIIFQCNCPMFPYAQTCICLVYILNIAFVFFPLNRDKDSSAFSLFGT